MSQAFGSRCSSGESQLGYHASGRSAAAFLESYGSPEIRALTRASRAALDEGELLAPRPLVWLAPPDQVGKLRTLLAAEPALREASEAEVRTLCPAVRPGWSVLNGVEDAAQDLDVAGLLELYRRLAVTNGVTIHTGASILDGERQGTGWLLRTGIGEVRATTVVNAAGAWADDVARRCGLPTVGLTPYRRTVAIVTSSAVDRAWPLVADIGETFYFRPEGDGLLLSPADETPSEPVDARAETEDVALALDRANEATTLNLRHVRTTWAGLRTFAPDRNPVVGAAAERVHLGRRPGRVRDADRAGHGHAGGVTGPRPPTAGRAHPRRLRPRTALAGPLRHHSLTAHPLLRYAPIRRQATVLVAPWASHAHGRCTR